MFHVSIDRASIVYFFFFNDTATTEIYTLSLHDALPIYLQDPGRRMLQKRLAEEVTTMVHSKEDLDMAIAASNILFGKATKESLARLDEATLNDVFKDVPHYELSKEELEIGRAHV